MPKQALCVGGCRQWFDASLHWCEHCGHERPRYNAHMYRVALDNSLYRAADSAHKEKQWETACRAGHDPPPPQHVERAAKKIVKDF